MTPLPPASTHGRPMCHHSGPATHALSMHSHAPSSTPRAAHAHALYMRHNSSGLPRHASLSPPLPLLAHGSHPHGPHPRKKDTHPQIRQLRLSVRASTELVVTGGKKLRAVVVGGGIGGLVTAGRLAKAGMDVRLLEQGNVVGGRCQSEHMGPNNEYRFDTGPSLLLFPQTYKRTYQALGTRIEDHLDVRRVEPAAYRVFFEGTPSGSASTSQSKSQQPPLRIDMFYDAQKMVEQLEAVEEGAGRQYLAWLADARAALDVGTRNFIERDFDGVFDFLNPARLLPLLGQVNIAELLGPHYERLAMRFKDPRLQALLTFQDLYVGLSPYSAPGVFSLLSATEITDGVWYPTGGFGTIRDSLREIIEQLGVRVSTNAGVAAINTSVAGEVAGITLKSGQVIEADIVVSNRDVPLSYGLLRGGATEYGRQQEDRISKLDYSAGVIAFYWCFNKRLHSLLHHNVFLSSEYRKSWNRATCPSTLTASPNFYVHCPVRTDSTAAPSGCDSVMVLLPVANLQQMVASGEGGGGSQKDMYESLVAEGRKAVLQTLKDAGVGRGKDLSSCIVSERVVTPMEWKEKYGLQHGAAFGLSHGLNQLALMRPPLKDPKVKGLYLVGASARPGNGVPLVMIGADLLVGRVMQDVKRGKLARK